MYWAIIKKDLKFIAPLTFIAVVIFSLIVRDYYNYFDHEFKMQNTLKHMFEMHDRYVVGDISSDIHQVMIMFALPHMVIFSILAVVIAFIQFLLPAVSGNWKYVLFRPVSRGKILACMMGTALAVIYFSGIIVWLFMCYAFDPVTIIPISLDCHLIAFYFGIIPVLCYLTAAYLCLGKLFSIEEKLPIVFTWTLGAIILAISHESQVQLCLFPVILLALYIPMVVRKFMVREY